MPAGIPKPPFRTPGYPGDPAGHGRPNEKNAVERERAESSPSQARLENSGQSRQFGPEVKRG